MELREQTPFSVFGVVAQALDARASFKLSSWPAYGLCCSSFVFRLPCCGPRGSISNIAYQHNCRAGGPQLPLPIIRGPVSPPANCQWTLDPMRGAPASAWPRGDGAGRQGWLPALWCCPGWLPPPWSARGVAWANSGPLASPGTSRLARPRPAPRHFQGQARVAGLQPARGVFRDKSPCQTPAGRPPPCAFSGTAPLPRRTPAGRRPRAVSRGKPPC